MLEQEMHSNIIMQDVRREYEEFVYIVSHDLSAPLRHLKEFSTLLLESLGSGLNADEKQYAQYIEKSLLRLGLMQNAILKLSRVRTHAQEFQSVDVNIIVERVIENLQDRNIQTAFSVSHNSLPTISIEENLFEEVMLQILDNACRYSYVAGEQKVYIKHFTTDKETVFEIGDNGIGIDAQFCDSVFSMFRRLHNQDDFGGGVGAGLTIVQKIIESWGGNIWIKSKISEGTKVFFSVPKKV